MARRKHVTAQEVASERESLAEEMAERAPAMNLAEKAIASGDEAAYYDEHPGEILEAFEQAEQDGTLGSGTVARLAAIRKMTVAELRERWHAVSAEIEELEKHLRALPEELIEEHEHARESQKKLRRELAEIDKVLAAPAAPLRITMDEQELQASADVNNGAARLVRIPLGELIPSPTNPRKHFEQSEIEALAANIRQQGLIEPIVVRPLEIVTFTFAHGSQESFGPASREQCEAKIRERQEGIAKGTLSAECETPGVYEIVAGERRYRAHVLLNDQDTPPIYDELTDQGRFGAIDCIVRDLTDRQVLEMQISENLQRADLTPLDWAAAYAAMVEEEQKHVEFEPGTAAVSAASAKGAVARVAERLGVSLSVVYQTMQLAKLIPEAAMALRKEYISKNHAIDCARLTPEQQLKYLGEAFGYYQFDPGEIEDVLNNGPYEVRSVRGMREWIKHKYGPASVTDALGEEPAVSDDAIEAAAEQQRQGSEMELGSNMDISADDNAAGTSQSGSCCDHRNAKPGNWCPDCGAWVRDPSAADPMAAKPGPSPQAKAQKVREAEKAIRLRAFAQAIRGAARAARIEKKLLTTEDLRDVALYAFSRVPGDYQVALGHALGWERTKGNGKYDVPNFEHTAEIEVPRMSRAKLGMLLLACSLAEGLTVPGYCETAADACKSVSMSFVRTLARHGVDLDEIRDQAKAAAKVGKASKSPKARGKKVVAA